MHIWPYIVVGATVGIAVGIYEYLRKKKNADGTSLLDSMLKEQYVSDSLTWKELKPWFIERREKCKENALGIILKMSATATESIGLGSDADIDADHYLIQVLYDSSSNTIDNLEANRIVDMRLVNFVAIDNGLKSKLDEKGMLVISL